MNHVDEITIHSQKLPENLQKEVLDFIGFLEKRYSPKPEIQMDEAIKLEAEASISSRWWREEELINQRLTWLLTAHALLGAGFAWLKYRVAEIKFNICESKINATPDELKNYQNELIDLMNFLAVIGISLSFLVGFGIFAACLAQNILQANYKNKGYKLGVSTKTTNIGRCTAIFFPVACCLAWVYMMPLIQASHCVVDIWLLLSIIIFMLTLYFICTVWESDKDKIIDGNTSTRLG